MKAILMSIHPKWCEKIFCGEKTIEVRKTAPKQETPFKVYVYCTKERMTRVPSMYAYLHKNEPRACAEYGTIETWGEIGDVIVNPHLVSKHVSFGMHGKVVGEFVCDFVEECIPDFDPYHQVFFNYFFESGNDCLTAKELRKYGNGRNLYGLHITEPKLYDKPKELSEFQKPCKMTLPMCDRCEYYSIWSGRCENITRPPQSWQYVEEVVE